MTKRKSPRNLVRRLIRNWAVPVGCGLLFLWLLRHVFFIGYVPSSSMEPTIREDSLIIGMRVAGKLEVGDIVVFEHNGLLLVKRIAGIPGDTVYSTDGNAMTVPSGCYYVLGDNTEASIDSRHWDEPFVTDKSIIAKVWTVH